MAETYLGMIDEQMDKIISTIMNAESNVMYFFGAGKDRTGVVSAIILKKLGYSDRVIIDDYMETKENLMDFLVAYVREHPQVDINIIIPNEENIRRWALEKLMANVWLDVVFSRVTMKRLSGYHRLSKDYRRQHNNNDAA